MTKTPKPLLLALALATAICVAPQASAEPGALTAEAVNDTGLTAAVDAGADDATVLRAQILLDRAHFSPGEIDGGFGSNTRKAIAAYQRSQGLEASADVDAETWAALNSDSADALVRYTITAEDVAGPFKPVPADMADKAKLDALGYTSAVEAMGEKFHASPKLLERLNPGAAMTAGTTIVVPNVTQPEVPKAAKVVVDQSDLSVSLVDAAGKTYARYPASTGSKNDPLPIGEWTIKGVATNPTFQYNPELFWDAEASDEKAAIPPGPNNPVGVVWVDLSKPHYGIHGTPEPSNIGKTQSHGCIRLTNWTARTLADAVAPGTLAVLQE